MWQCAAKCRIGFSAGWLAGIRILGAFMRKWLLTSLTFAFALTGCGKKSSSESTYLLPWSDAKGNYSLQEVTISTLTSGHAVKGQAAEVYAEPSFSESGFSGHIAEPRLTHSGHVYIPMDIESSLALTVYAQFERIYQFEQAIGTAGQLRWPRKIGVELNLTTNDGSDHNNAHYFTALDVIGILPYTLDGVPFAVNQGIVAHEHFHAHFQSQVLSPLSAIAGLQVVSALEDLFYGAISPAMNSGRDGQGPKFLNDIVLRGWNEGLADFFAGIYTGQADFFSGSMPKIAKARALDEPLRPILPGADLEAAANAVGFDRSKLVGMAYGQGTAVARLLYRAANSGAETPRAFLIRTMNQLKEIPASVQDGYLSRVMDFDEVLPVLLDGFPLSHNLCADLQSTMTKATYMRGFAACAGL